MHRKRCSHGYQRRPEFLQRTILACRVHVLCGYSYCRCLHQRRHAIYQAELIPGWGNGKSPWTYSPLIEQRAKRTHLLQVIWGIMATLQAVAGGPSGMYAIRFFLGVFEAAFISGAPYLTTVLYPRAVRDWHILPTLVPLAVLTTASCRNGANASASTYPRHHWREPSAGGSRGACHTSRRQTSGAGRCCSSSKACSPSCSASPAFGSCPTARTTRGG